MRAYANEEQLRNFLEIHGVDVRLWDVDPTGVFCGIIFDGTSDAIKGPMPTRSTGSIADVAPGWVTP